MSTNAMYTVVNNLVVRIQPHACQCDECKLLDAQDLESLRLAHCYLDENLPFEEWWDAEIGNSIGEKDVAINRFNSSLGAKSGPNGLSTMIDCLYWSFGEDRGPFEEKLFRQLLRQLVEGYETRMRTVHFWKLVVPEAK